MDTAIRDIVFVAVGFVLAWAPQWFDRQRKIKAHWSALRADMLGCVERTTALLDDGVMAPLYRLPTVAFEKGYPVLLLEGELVEDESLVLGRFFYQAQDINRGLDNATAMAHADRSETLEKEYRRNISKARELVGDSGSGEGLSKDAFELVNKKLAKSRFGR